MMAIIERIQRKRRGRINEYERLHIGPLLTTCRALGMEVGFYSYVCFDIPRFLSGITVGRYRSIAYTARVFLRNHGIGSIGMTFMLYRPEFGVVDCHPIRSASLSIGDNVWMGHDIWILPGVGSIGRGALIAADAIVTRRFSSYPMIAGNPVRHIRVCFSGTVIDATAKNRWWERDPAARRQLVQGQSDFIFQPEKYLARD